jgi:hypothetical protein
VGDSVFESNKGTITISDFEGGLKVEIKNSVEVNGFAKDASGKVTGNWDTYFLGKDNNYYFI